MQIIGGRVVGVFLKTEITSKFHLEKQFKSTSGLLLLLVIIMSTANLVILLH